MSEYIPTCLDCAIFRVANGRSYCGQSCLSCIGHDPASLCCNVELWKPKDATVNKAIVEYAEELAVKEAEGILEARRLEEEEHQRLKDMEPKIEWKCVECGAVTVLPLTEYTDKRKRRKYEFRNWCDVCFKVTNHEWSPKE